MSEQEKRQGILALPTELIHTILLALPPLCIEHFSQTCKLARRHVYGEHNIGDMHLWKQLYLQRFDDFPSLWEASNDSTFREEVQENQHEHEQNALAASSSSSSASSVASSSKHAASSIMALVQLRDRAARLYAGDPSNHGPITLNFNAVLSALLSVIDTAVPHASDPCRNSDWLDESILSSGQPTWSEWVFPRSIMNSLEEFKLEDAAASRSKKRSQSPQERKRRRLTANQGPSDSAEKKQGSPTQSPKGSPSRRRSSSSKSTSNERPDSIRRRSARLLKLIYPESLHGLVDEGIDIDALAQPQMRLAARIHCLHGIRAWKDSQKQRLTASPQEIANQRQQDGLANQGAAQASEENNASAQNASTSSQTDTNGQQSQNGQQDGDARAAEEGTGGGQGSTAADSNVGTSEAAAEDGSHAEGEDDDAGEDDESFDEPPAAILRFRPRMFGPSLGFCNAPDEEDEVRARMRHRVYDSGYYGWSNGYGPLHAWRYDPHAEDDDDDDEDAAGEGQEDDDEHHDDDDDVAMADAGVGSEDGDDDAFREAAELSDGSDDIPDDPVPIEIETGRDEDDRRTFQVADRYGNPIDTSASDNNAATRGWDSSDDDDEEQFGIDAHRRETDRAPFQTPDLGAYDADTRTYTYEGDLAIGIVTSSRDIQVTVGNTIDFVATGVLNIRFIRPGMLAETMRVTSGNGAHIGREDDPFVVDDEVDEDDVEDDDYDEDADDWNDYGGEEEDDDNFGPYFDMFRPLSGAAGYRGCRADEEIRPLVEQRDAEQKQDDKEVATAEQSRKVSLRRKSIHWELVEAIMVVMYANLKEAIWLENWGVGIRIPKIYDDAGIMIKDPMERREFLDFPTGWISSLPNPIPSKLHVEDVSDRGSGGKEATPMDTTPKISEGDSLDSSDAKPHDWARCESFWAGTYAFLDYSHFVDFNVRMARRRREAIARAEAAVNGNGKQASNGDSYAQSTPKPNLVGQEEAVGDCLQLRLELLPKSQQPVYNTDEEGQEDDEDYPTLFFRGTTVTYWGNEAPMPRGGVHGKVRPVYAREEDVDEILSKGPRGKKKIEGLHWSLTHVYEGEDRWQLEGIQPGPPGTRAPIFGIWTDALHEEESPNGPFVYWMMDERPWKEIERMNRQDAHDAAAARAAGNR